MTPFDGKELVKIWFALLSLQEETLHENNGGEEQFHLNRVLTNLPYQKQRWNHPERVGIGYL
jgi:hypothetical protein